MSEAGGAREEGYYTCMCGSGKEVRKGSRCHSWQDSQQVLKNQTIEFELCPVQQSYAWK